MKSNNRLTFVLLAFIILICVAFLQICSSINQDNPQALFEIVFAEGGKRNPKIVFKKEVNLDLTPEKEFVYIIRNGNEEIFVVLNETKRNILFKKVFTLLNIGPIVYDSEKKKMGSKPF